MTQRRKGDLPDWIEAEFEEYRSWIQKYRARQIGEIKMQKIRLQLGTYHQRQAGVQMQRIKFPGGTMSSDQLSSLADIADKYANGFIHFTTREDAQLYYLKLEECPDMLKDLARAGITTREACGNTVRNITSCYRSGVAADQVFDTVPYAHALYRFLVRNKFNQVMGRKFKIAFESCPKDHAGMRIHDFGFQAVVRNESGKIKRGFRTYLGGGLGAVPSLGHLYTEFLPEEEMMNLAAATVRLFDRHGERKNRMVARMKFLIKKMGWEKFKEALDQERRKVNLPASVNAYLKEIHAGSDAVPSVTDADAENPLSPEKQISYEAWVKDSVLAHQCEGFCGVHVRLPLGDLLTDKARALAEAAETYSCGQIRISIEQNLFLPWVPKKLLPALYAVLDQPGLVQLGAETMEDTTTCPGADTCRLGITSAKGLGAHVSEALKSGLSSHKEILRNLRVKVSGCPNGCAQHGVAAIGFQGAALQKDGKTVPAHEVFVGGGLALNDTALGERLGKVPARNGAKVVGVLVDTYAKEKQGDESFSACMKRLGKSKLQEILEPFTQIPSFDEDPSYYKDWGHGNEKFSIRTGVKGECAGAPIQEKAPVMSDAKERLAQAEAFLMHEEYFNAQLEAYEAMGQAVRVPLYANLVDPFTSEQALWEFENVFVRAGKTPKEWLDLSEKCETAKSAASSEDHARSMIEIAKKLILSCETLYAELTAPKK
ncbi:nitrite/sulfite reductase [Omnitrophica bacterium]|nr:nitrite/sulfite reductase [Candidatus Omnitrophota bacterium]